MILKKHLPKLGQVLIRFGKEVAIIVFNASFFCLRTILFYYLFRWAYHPQWFALFGAVVLACGSHVRFFRKNTDSIHSKSL